MIRQVRLDVVIYFSYTIELEHGRYKWKVIKRYKDFSYLSSRLMAHRAAEMIKAPVRRFFKATYPKNHAKF